MPSILFVATLATLMSVATIGHADPYVMEPFPGCPSYSNMTAHADLFRPRCCGDEEFSYGHLDHFVTDCSVPPEDKNLSISGLHWAFFECLITKSLGSKEMTLESFAEAMTSNFSVETKSAILTTLKQRQQKERSNKKQNKMANLDTVNPKHKVEKYWTKYFDAEFEVCSEKLEEFSERNFNNSSYLLGDEPLDRNLWEPMDTCNTTRFPYVNFLNLEKKMTCTTSLNEKYGFNENSTFSEFYCVEASCTSMSMDWITEKELIEGDIDYEAKLKPVFPKYWSESAKKNILDLWPRAMQHLLNETMTLDSPSIAEGVKLSENWGAKNTEVSDDLKPRCKRALTLSGMMLGLLQAHHFMCYGEWPQWHEQEEM